MKLRPIIAAAAILLSCVSCSSTPEKNERPSVRPTQPSEIPTEQATERIFSKPAEETDDSPRIRNYMNPDEKRSVNVHALSLLDKEETKEHSENIRGMRARQIPEDPHVSFA